MTMAFWDSDEDVEVSDKELKEYKRHHLTSSDNQSRMNLISKISEILKPISTPCLKSEATNYPVAENTIDFLKANNGITSKLKLSSSELIENGAKIFCSEEEDRKQKQLSSQDFQKVVLNWMAKIDKKIDMLLQQQATTGISTPSPVPSDTIFERCLTKSDVDLLEEKVKANNVFKGRVLNVLSRSGGCSAYKSAFAIGKLLMSEEAGSCFNVSGGLFKTNFKTYTLYQLIVDAIMRQHHNAKVTECHSGISEFLRQSGTRHNRKGLKMNHVANSEPSSKG
ncbi:uncharacterized protein LOC136092307 [Hydra vulgaris]|uniref:Uncharacterized protein LOC136092307 n=1 Tax=Hydra vulgaris TaxID=6087 RepID=A0ABM4DNY7_HYDVU